MIRDYDVVIAGAGSSGLMAARTAGESGLKIALLERKKDISIIGREDGGIVALNEYLYGQVVTFNRRAQTLVFPVSGFSIKYDGPWNDHRYGFHIYSPGGNRLRVGDWSALKKDPAKNSKGIALCKGRLLKGLLKEAQAFGVDYFPDTNVEGVTPTADGVSVETNRGGFCGKYLVAADGVNSRIVRELGLNKKRGFIGTTRYLAWEMSGVQPPESEGLIFVMTMYGIFSISQVHQEGHYHVGIVSGNPQEVLTPLLEKFTRDDPVFSPWFKKAQRTDHTECCVVNAWQAIEKPFHQNVMLVGDACWSHQFSTPPSLCAGYHLGHALTKAFIDKKFQEEGIAQYLNWYETSCYKPYGQLGFGGGDLAKYLTAEEMDYLAAMVPEPLPSTASFIHVFNTILEAYQPHISRIKAEQPQILEKFTQMGQDMEKTQTEKRKTGFPNR